MKFFSRNKEVGQVRISGNIVNLEKIDIMKALTTIAIERALLSIGKPVLDKVTVELYKQHRCYIPDCYEHPENLENTLKSIFGYSYNQIVNSIKDELQDHMYDQRILALVRKIER
jgi:hypothetical protein